MNEKIVLYNNNSSCCGCGACMNICHKQAITMKKDKYGFLYPSIDDTLCVKCGTCREVCHFQNIDETNIPLKTYACSSVDDKQILKSASGGIFAAFATLILNNGGVVFGASMENIDNKLTPMHIGITDKNDLIKLQGSKYVQSYIGKTYNETKEYLLNGKTVLFSGTPCQVAGLKGFLKKDYENLITVDIICHGVPSAKLFQDYIETLEEKLDGKIVHFKFRDKTKGWGLTGKAVYKTKSREKKEKLIPCELSSYYKLFLKSDTYRESCYSCKYASSHRPGDITIGDYWGIQNEHPELMTDKGGALTEDKGISCIMVNTVKGELYLEQFNTSLNLYESTFEMASRRNGQLNTPSKKGADREKILELYSTKGYCAVEKYFRKQVGFKIYFYKFKNILPRSLKKNIKKVLGKE